MNITSPCDDFYKRIPNPAFKVWIQHKKIKSICLILIFSPLSVASLNTACGELLSENLFLFFLFLCCSGLLSSMFSRSRPCWGWRLTTPCLWPRTRLLEKQWWPSTPSLSHRNTWRGVYLCTAQKWAKPFFSTSCKTEVVLVFKAGKEARNTNDTRQLWLTAHIVVCRRWFDPQLHMSHHWARYWTPNCSWWKFYMCKTCAS